MKIYFAQGKGFLLCFPAVFECPLFTWVQVDFFANAYTVLLFICAYLYLSKYPTSETKPTSVHNIIKLLYCLNIPRELYPDIPGRTFPFANIVHDSLLLCI